MDRFGCKGILEWSAHSLLLVIFTTPGSEGAFGANVIQNGEVIHDICYSEGYCGHCGLKVLLGQMHSRLLRTFLIFVIVKSVHGHWGVSFILDHCCSKEICGHCGLKVSLLR